MKFEINGTPRPLIEVGYYLSRFGHNSPPSRLLASTWDEAYFKFYNALNEGKTEENFRSSLKNIRDQFDGRFPNGRVGWLDSAGQSRVASEDKEQVFLELEELDEESIWRIIRPYASLDISKKRRDKTNTVIDPWAKFFSSEFSGSVKLQNRLGTEMNFTHGAVMDSLYKFVSEKYKNDKIYNTCKIDLLVECAGEIIAIFELKTSSNTQSIYTAIGQLFMHSVGNKNAEKYLVLPEPVQNDELLDCFEALGVRLITYSEESSKYKFQMGQTKMKFLTYP